MPAKPSRPTAADGMKTAANSVTIAADGMSTAAAANSIKTAADGVAGDHRRGR